MQNHEQNWSLFRLSDRKQFDDIKLETIDFFFRALNEKSRPDWLMWREGFSGWRPFSELPQILKHLQKDARIAPPPVPDAVLQFADEVTGVRHEETPAEATAVEIDELAEEDEVEEARFAPQALDSSHSGIDSNVIFQSPHAEPGDEEPMEDDLTPTADIPANLAQSQSMKSVPTTEPVSDDDVFSKSHSSVSVRAIQAATSNLRLKTNTGISSLQRSPKPSERILDERLFTQEDAATLSLMLESQAAVEDRNNVRYQKRFKVRIYTSQGVVSAVTTDCSTSGLRFKEPLPAGLPRFFHLEIDLGPEGKIPLVCSEIKEKDGSPPRRVRIQVNDHANALKSALVRAA